MFTQLSQFTGSASEEAVMVQGKVLLVEDDENVLELVSSIVRGLGLEPVTASNGRVGLERALSEDFSLVILDVMLPELEGTEVCQRLRAVNETVPVMMLTAKGEELDRVIGLELGADDYLTKPFSSAELKARLKALLRRSQLSEKDGYSSTSTVKDLPVIEIEQFRIDLNTRVVTHGGSEVALTATEFDLFAFLAAHPGRAFSREQLLREVWDQYAEGYLATVNAHINRLRRKIEPDPQNPQYIETVRGFGYRFADPKTSS